MVAVVVLTVVVALVFLASGGMKLLSLPYSARIRDRFGMSPRGWRTIGVLELVGVTGLLAGIAVPLLGDLAGVGLLMLMVGSFGTRLRVRDPVAYVLGDVAIFLLVAVYIAVTGERLAP